MLTPTRLIQRLLVAATLVAVVGSASQASATTLRRMGLEELTRTNESVVFGRVLEIDSHWNADGTFILTEVTFAPSAVLKGQPTKEPITFTVMGGSIGELTTLIIAGVELSPGADVMLFLSHADLPGADGVLTVRDHCQGAFDLVLGADGLRAISQARVHPLLSDDRGVSEPPGGAEGLSMDFMLREVNRFAANNRK